MFTHTATCVPTVNSLVVSGAGLTVKVTQRKVKAGVRVRIVATLQGYRGTGNPTRDEFRDYASVEEAARVFSAQCVRWHNYTQAWAIQRGYTQAA
jgi:hypothetical protein